MYGIVTAHGHPYGHDHYPPRPEDSLYDPYRHQHNIQPPYYPPPSPQHDDYVLYEMAGPHRASSSSSIAHALDHTFAPQYTTPDFPHNEVVPQAPVPSQGEQEYSSYEALHKQQDAGIGGSGGYNDMICDNDEYIAYVYDDSERIADTNSYHGTPEVMYTASPVSEGQTEVGYLNGQVVPLGLVGENQHDTDEQLASNLRLTTPMSELQLQCPAIAPLVIPSPHPAYQLTRSYTLAEAITPVEAQQRPNETRHSNNLPRPDLEPTNSMNLDSNAKQSAHSTDTDPGYPRGRPKKDSLAITTSTEAATPPPPPLPVDYTFPKLPEGSCEPRSPSVVETPTSPSVADEVSSGRPGESVLKLAVTSIPREAKKKPVMACLFCRERKIACGPPSPDDEDRTCKQCRRRGLVCQFPKECRRGQHKRTPRAVARAKAIANGGTVPLDVYPPDGPTFHSSGSASAGDPSAAMSLPQGGASKSASKERRKSSKAKDKDPQVAAERRAVIRLQRQMASAAQQQRYRQHKRSDVPITDKNLPLPSSSI